jgi:hypothetical protein
VSKKKNFAEFWQNRKKIWKIFRIFLEKPAGAAESAETLPPD